MQNTTSEKTWKFRDNEIRNQGKHNLSAELLNRWAKKGDNCKEWKSPKLLLPHISMGSTVEKHSVGSKFFDFKENLF